MTYADDVAIYSYRVQAAEMKVASEYAVSIAMTASRVAKERLERTGVEGRWLKWTWWR